MAKLLRLCNTVKYLKIRQLFWRLFYMLRKKVFKYQPSSALKYECDCRRLSDIVLIKAIPRNQSWSVEKIFTFLNCTYEFSSKIDWDYDSYGKLWTYNLNYHDFINQEGVDKEAVLKVISDFVYDLPNSTNALEPYPLSLRIINWVKFFSKFPAGKNEVINRSLYGQSVALSQQLEKHLLGNHYLENGFGLLFAAYHFKDEKFYNIAKYILLAELEEQILDDGAHFELSPMYHQILLDRVLDCYNLTSNNNWKGNELGGVLQEKAEMMLVWLKQVTFMNGEIPLVNDATRGIAPSTQQLCAYAQRLGLSINSSTVSCERNLSTSGYRMIQIQNYELFCDVGRVGPDYIPGHAHADTLNFVLYVDGKPLIIDPGISTYEKNTQRQLERGTCFHNTVSIVNENSSEVWGGFRVAKRAKISQLFESDEDLTATHDGYHPIIHQRTWNYSEKAVSITDKVSADQPAKAFLHFSPGIEPKIKKNELIIGGIRIVFKGINQINVESYQCPNGYNRFQTALKAVVEFRNELITVIKTQANNL